MIHQEHIKSIELQIKEFIVNELFVTQEEASHMTLQQHMSLIEIKNKEKWNEFKLGLRKSGYII